jgi:predicted DNA-binding transcriptional regulator YafY/predicted transcriptional regulator YdeE
MPKEKTRLSRLIQIICILQTKRLITASEIAEKFDISIRTVYRDIKTIEQAGIPVYNIEGKGYSLIEGYNLPPINFSEEEAIALLLSNKLIEKNKDYSLQFSLNSAMDKIKAGYRTINKDYTEELNSRTEVRENIENTITSDNLIDIQKSIFSRQKINIQYQNSVSDKTNRTICPLLVYYSNTNWILIAKCDKRKDIRSFRLDRIIKIEFTKIRFEDLEFDFNKYYSNIRKKYFPTPDISMSVSRFSFAENKNINIMSEIKMDCFQVLGIHVRTSNKDYKSANDISQLWAKFWAENISDKISCKLGTEIYSVYTNYESDQNGEYDCIIGFRVDNISSVPDNMKLVKIEKSNYKKFTAKGDIIKGIVANKWQEIWEINLNRTYSADFEVYDNRASNPENAEVDIFVGVI